MLNSWLEYEEQDALKKILRHGTGEVDPALLANLATFINWIKANEKAKARFSTGSPPPYLLVLLSQMGIYGADALDPPTEVPSGQG